MITKEEELQVIELHYQGMTRNQISEILGITPGRVRGYIRRSGLSVKVSKGVTCKGCNSKFDQLTGNHYFCEKSCKDRYYHLKTRPPRGPVPKQCDVCGSEFMATMSKARFCSNYCRLDYLTPKFNKECIYCGANYIGSAGSSDYCSNKCSDNSRYEEYRKSLPTYNKKCCECSDFFSTNGKNRKFCQTDCSRKYHGRLKELRKRERIIANGPVDKDISIERLMDRDNKTCYLCNEKCEINDFEVRDCGTIVTGPNYPSVDHIIPVSKGGTHTWDNVMLACRKCNIEKRDIVL